MVKLRYNPHMTLNMTLDVAPHMIRVTQVPHRGAGISEENITTDLGIRNSLG